MAINSKTPFVSRVDAKAQTSAAKVRVIELNQTAEAETVLREDGGLWLDFSVKSRLPNTELSFSKRWPENRYEAPGRLFVLPPHHEMRIRSGVGKIDLVICRLTAEFLVNIFEDDFEWTDQRLDASVDVANASINQLMLSLGAEVQRPGLASKIILEALASQIAVLLARDFHENHKSGGLRRWQIRAIEERIHMDGEGPSLLELAQLCRLSIRQLSRSFKAERGVSIGHFVSEQRADIARRRLASGESMKSVAYALGFSSPSSFGKAFHKLTGLTPGEYRRKLN